MFFKYSYRNAPNLIKTPQDNLLRLLARKK